MSEYLWTGGAGDDDFGDANNWFNVNTNLPGEPMSGDVAVLETAGTIKGAGTVAVLDLISSGGTLKTQALSVSATEMELAGTVDVAAATKFIVTDNLLVAGTSTIVQSNGSAFYIEGSDGTAGDVVSAMTFGQSSSDNVSYALTGLGTLLDASDGNISIGGAGTAKVTVTAGATLETDGGNVDGSGNVTLGGAAGAQGNLVVTGAYSTLSLAGILAVGGTGTGHFTLSGGADTELAQVFTDANGSTAMIVGDSAGSTGSAVITGAGTRLGSLINSVVVVGESGTGTMTISAGATANFGELGIGVAATGSVVITGAGSTLELHDLAVVGDDANGTLQVLAGAHMGMVGNESDSLAVGDLATATGKLIVSGAGSVLSADNNQAQIGYYGTGTAIISSGGAIVTGAPTTSPSNTATFVGTEAGSVGAVTVENAGSTWKAVGDFDVGYYGKGTLLVESGGAVSSGNYNGVVGFIAGNEAGASGTVTVTGSGSKITNSGHFIVGNSGAATLTIAAAATVTTTVPSGSTTDGAIIGGISGGTGSVTVTGAGSTWSIGTDLIVGSAGTGSLGISTGGTVRAGSLLMAMTGTGTLNLAGANTKLAVSGAAQFGSLAKAAVTVGSGSVLSVGATAELKDGHITLAGGSLSVTHTLSIDPGQLASGNGTITAATIANSGTIYATGGALTVDGAITGTGVMEIASGSTLQLDSSAVSTQRIIFATGANELALAESKNVFAHMANFSGGDRIDLLDTAATKLSFAAGLLTVTDGTTQEARLRFAGSYTNANFQLASDGHDGSLISYVPSS